MEDTVSVSGSIFIWEANASLKAWENGKPEERVYAEQNCRILRPDPRRMGTFDSAESRIATPIE